MPHRICVIGCAGAGKSHLADRLGARYGLPVIHLDALYWRPGWVEPPRDDWRAVQRDLVRAPRWVLDGNYSATMDERLPHADLVVFLDYSTVRCLAGVFSRRLRERGGEVAPGCRRRLTWDFIRYTLRFRRSSRDRFRRSSRDRVLANLAEHTEPSRVVRLRNRREAARWLAGLTSGRGADAAGSAGR